MKSALPNALIRPLAHGGNMLQAARAHGCAPEEILDFSNNADTLVHDITARLVRETPYPFEAYPESDSPELCAALAAHEGVPPEQILVGNGSSELIYLAIAALRPGRALAVAPIFSEHVLACERFGACCDIYSLSEERDFQLQDSDIPRIVDAAPDMTLVCTPNNPTGVVLDEVFALIERIPSGVVVIDAAYREFLHGSPVYQKHSHREYANHAQPGVRVLTLGSFTKYFNCPGVRLGYVVSDPQTLSQLKEKRAPWMLARYNEQIGLKMLENLEEYRAARNGFGDLRGDYVAALRETGLFARLQPSVLNFITCKLRPDLDSVRLYDFLYRRKILVRVCDNIPGMPEKYIRMQVKSADENRVLLKALSEFAAM